MTNLNNSFWIPDELYRQIISVMPIPCVDLIVQDGEDRILMLKRKNEPAKGQWWLPGGRIHFGESRNDTARRKLKEECGLDAANIREIYTVDIIYCRKPNQDYAVHGISTIFWLKAASCDVKIDSQSSTFSWKSPVVWMDETTDKFLQQILKQFISLK